MRLRNILRRGRLLLPICLVGMVTSASSQHFDPESYADDEEYRQQAEDITGSEQAEDAGAPEPADPSAAPRAYTVQEGDTLWDISQRVLGSPWYWPQVWSHNPEIANPHWIYPGNVIRFMAPSAVGPAQVLDSSEGMGAEEYGMEEQVVSSTGDLIYRVPSTVNVVDRGFVTKEEIDSVGRIVAAFEEKTLLTRYDRIYVDVPEPELGQRYVAFRTAREMVHPETGEFFGYQTELVGTVRIVDLDPEGGLATAEVGDTLDAVQRGDKLLPWSDAFTRDVVVRENQVELEGIIIAAQTPRSRVFGESNYVFIDRGRADGVEVGNTFQVMRRGDPLADYLPELEEGVELPWESIGQILVVETRDGTSVGLVLRSVREISPGERVEMRVDGGERHAAR